MKRLKICLILVVLFISSLVLYACSKTMDKYIPVDEDYTFENQEEQHAETDENMTIDGKFEESFLEDQKWLTNVYNAGPDDDVVVKSTSYFGEKGIYLAIEVQDSKVNYNSSKDIYYNSGLEVYFAAEDVTDATNGLYRYIFNAGGGNLLNKYVGTSGDGYGNLTLGYESAPFSKTELQGGKINTPACTGYNTEIFIPYGIFDKTVDNIWFNIALLRSETFAADSQDRVWYSFAENELGGGWTTPSSWWSMGADGLNAYDVNITVEGNGSVTSETDYLLTGGRVALNLKAEQGYRLKSLTLNGEDVTEEVDADAEGNMTYTTPSMKEDAVIVAVFEQIPSETYAVSGNITLGGQLSADLNADIAAIRFLAGGSIYEAEFNAENGTFTAVIPVGIYNLIIESSEGYTIKSQKVTIDSEENFEIDVSSFEWGENRIITIKDSQTSAAPITLFDGELSTNKFVFGAFFGIGNGHDFMDTQYCVTDLYFNFSDGARIWLQFLNWNYSLVVKDEDHKAVSETYLPSNIVNLEKQNGGSYIVIFVDGDNVSFWMDDGTGTFIQVKAYTIEGLGSQKLTSIVQQGAEGVSSERPFVLENIRIALNASTMEEAYPNVVVNADYDADRATVNGLNSSYKYGEKVSFTVETDPEYSVRVMLGNKELTASEGTYSFTASVENNIRVYVYSESDKAHVVGALEGSLNYSGLTLTFVGIGEPVETTVMENNVVDVNNIAFGSYKVYLTVNGTQVLLGEVDIYEANYDFSMTVGVITANAKAEVSLSEEKVSLADEDNADYLVPYVLDGMSETDTVYLRTVWQLTERTLTANGGKIGADNIASVGIQIKVGTQTFTLRYVNEPNTASPTGRNIFFQSTNFGAHWSGSAAFTSSDYLYTAMAGEGLPIIIELNPANGKYAVYIEQGSDIVKIVENTIPNINNATVTGIGIVTWNSCGFTFSEMEFIDSLGANYTDIKAQVTANADEVTFSGADGTYNYGDEISFTVLPKEGYTVTAILYNGKSISLTESGEYTVTCGITANIEVVSAPKITIEGSITLDGSTNDGLNADIDRIELIKDGATLAVTYENGSYSVTLAQGTYELRIYSKQGYCIVSREITYTENITQNIDITSEEWNEGRTLISVSDISTKGQTNGYAEVEVFNAQKEDISVNVYSFNAFLSVEGGGYMANGTQSCVTSINFYYSDGSKLEFQMLKWGNLYAKFANIGGTDTDISSKYPALVEAERANGGANLMFFFNGKNITVSMLNKDGEYVQVFSTTGGIQSETATLSKITIWGAVVDGADQTPKVYSLTDITLGLGKTDFSEVLPAVQPEVTVNDETKATVNGLKESYAYGETVTFTVSAEEGWLVTVSLNGQVISAQDGQYTFTASTRMEIAVTVVEVSETTVTGALESAVDLEGVTLTLIGENEYTCVIGAGNSVNIENVTFGTYEAYLDLFGKRIAVGSVVINSAPYELSLNVTNFVTSNGATVDIAQGSVSFMGSNYAEPLVVSGLSETETVYLKTVWQIPKSVVDTPDASVSICFVTGDKTFTVRYLNQGSKFFQSTNFVMEGGYWVGSDSFDENSYVYNRLTGEGLTLIFEFNPANGEYVVYAQMQYDLQTFISGTLPGYSGLTLNGIKMQEWNGSSFTISGIKFINGLEEYLPESVKPNLTQEEGAVNISGLSESYKRGDEVTFEVVPVEGYEVVSVTVNGVELSGAGENGTTYTATCGTTLEINIVTILADTKVDVTFTVDEKYAADGV